VLTDAHLIEELHYFPFEELLGDHFGDEWQLEQTLHTHGQGRVVQAERQQVHAEELFGQVRPQKGPDLAQELM
jgi:hypothetical protein